MSIFSASFPLMEREFMTGKVALNPTLAPKLNALSSKRMKLWASANRPEETRNALLCNLKLMKRALTKDQYRKYVALINVTRANQEDKVSNPLLDSYLAEK